MMIDHRPKVNIAIGKALPNVAKKPEQVTPMEHVDPKEFWKGEAHAD